MMQFPKSSLQSIAQLHSPTQEGAEISREKPRCCCIPLASPWIVPSAPGWGWDTQGSCTAPQMAQLLSCALGCRTALSQSQDIPQHCSCAYSELFTKHPEALKQLIQQPWVGQSWVWARLSCGTSCGATLLSLHCIPNPVFQWGDPGVQPAWRQLRSTGFVPQALPHTAVWTQTAMKTTAEYKQSYSLNKNTWSLANSAKRALSTSAWCR